MLYFGFVRFSNAKIHNFVRFSNTFYKVFVRFSNKLTFQWRKLFFRIFDMRYTIEEIRQMPEGQTFDCKIIHIEPKALANTLPYYC